MAGLVNSFNSAAVAFSEAQPARASHPLGWHHLNSMWASDFFDYVLDLLGNYYGNCRQEDPLKQHTWICFSLDGQLDPLHFNAEYTDLKLYTDQKTVDVFCKTTTTPFEVSPSTPYECVAEVRRPNGYSLRYSALVEEGELTSSFIDEFFSGSSTRFSTKDLKDILDPKFDPSPFADHIRQFNKWQSHWNTCTTIEILDGLKGCERHSSLKGLVNMYNCNEYFDPSFCSYLRAANDPNLSFFSLPESPSPVPPPTPTPIPAPPPTPNTPPSPTPPPTPAPSDNAPPPPSPHSYDGPTPTPSSYMKLVAAMVGTASAALLWYICRNKREEKAPRSHNQIDPRNLPNRWARAIGKPSGSLHVQMQKPYGQFPFSRS